MKFTKKAIEGILSSKIDEWLATVKLTTTYFPAQDLKHHIIITGGSIVSLLLGETPNDYDVYLDKVNICKTLVEYYCGSGYIINLTESKPGPEWIVNKRVRPTIPGSLYIERNESVGVFDKDTGAFVKPPTKKHYKAYYGNKINKIPGNGVYTLVLVTNNSLSLTDDIQIITRICGSPMEIHQTFDFVHCVSYYTQETGLILNRFALESILTKELKYMGTPYPICSLFRMKKFINRGWTIANSEMLKIITDVMKTPLTKRSLDFQLQNGINSPWNDFIKSLPDDVELTELHKTDLFNLIEAA